MSSMLNVKLFAKAKEIVGQPIVELPWVDGQTVGQLKQALAVKYPNLSPLMSRLLVAVNSDYAAEESPIKSNDEVACFPPVSGG